METFRDDNTEGFTAEQLDWANAQWRERHGDIDPDSDEGKALQARILDEAALAGYREPYERGGLMRWDLPGNRYVLGDSSIGGGGCCIRDARTDYVLVQGTAEVAAIIGEDHPAIAECRALTEVAREEQRRFGRMLQYRWRHGY